MLEVLPIQSKQEQEALCARCNVPFDTELKHFSIARDEEYIIPIIKEILAINPHLFIYASPWTPPDG